MLLSEVEEYCAAVLVKVSKNDEHVDLISNPSLARLSKSLKEAGGNFEKFKQA